MPKKCRISYYNVVAPNGAITFGYRCSTHGVMTQRFSTPAIREERVAQHREHPKKTKKF